MLSAVLFDFDGTLVDTTEMIHQSMRHATSSVLGREDIPRETLLARVWGDEYRDQTDYLKVYVSRLRAKIEDDPERPRFILTERGLGYRFARAGVATPQRPSTPT